LAILIGCARGLPVVLTEQCVDTGSGLTSTRERLHLGLYAATGLPIIVAVTEVALNSDLMNAATASLLVGAGALTVLVFPLVAQLLQHSDHEESESPGVPAQPAG
jgi:3-deoxy-D-arabino-heptulosonate 7-phosphate (DAHP) synthase